MYKKALFLLCLLPIQILVAQTGALKNFPDGSTPDEIGKRLASRFVKSKHLLHANKWIGYPETCSWNGALKFATITKDKRLTQMLKEKFEPLFTTDNRILPAMTHVDQNMFGSLPLEFYRITKEKRYKELGMPYADTQWEIPENATIKQKGWADKGYTWQTRLWIDDMYMITIVQTQAYKVTKDKKYLDRTAKEMVMYLDELQRPNGLFYHAPDVPYYWGRGNGWVAAGMAELLQCLPKKHKDRPRILQGFRTMMESLKRYRNPEGLWNQLIDQPDCWTETSGSAMFTFAFIKGVKNGWLDAIEYAPVARKAWIALVRYINDENDVKEVCIGTNKKNDKQYYYDRPRRTGDFHGQAPYLWCAAALLE